VRSKLRTPQSVDPSRGSKGTKAKQTAADPAKGLFSKGFNKVGPRNADSIPLPLIILAGLAFLLIAAGGAGLVSRRLRARKVAG
jgi:hypothetical protein